MGESSVGQVLDRIFYLGMDLLHLARGNTRRMIEALKRGGGFVGFQFCGALEHGVPYVVKMNSKIIVFIYSTQSHGAISTGRSPTTQQSKKIDPARIQYRKGSIKRIVTRHALAVHALFSSGQNIASKHHTTWRVQVIFHGAVVGVFSNASQLIQSQPNLFSNAHQHTHW